MATHQLGPERYMFNLDWYDEQAGLIRKFTLSYFPVTREIEMYDVKNVRIFLKKMEIPSIQLEDFYVGSKVTILSRAMKVTDYGDVRTRQRFEEFRGRTFAMIKPDSYQNIGKIINEASAAGFDINKLKMSKFSKDTAGQFYAEHQGKPFFDNLTNFMCGDVCVGMELCSTDAVAKWRQVIGPTNSENAKREAPSSVRAKFGTDGTRNAVHGSDSSVSQKRESEFFLGGMTPADRPMQTTAVMDNCTLCLIKPHVVKEGLAGQVIDAILEAGFEISAMEMFNLSRPVIEEFYEVYKHVLPEYLPLIEHMTNGPLIALEVRQNDAVNAFRDFCGPHDPEIAKHIRKNTLR